jgi:predicted O-methyltransferase YrrM
MLDPEDERARAAARIRSVVDRVTGDRSTNTAADGSRHDARTVSISVGEGEALTRWVLHEKAVKTIEIGLAFGVSALRICAGLIESGNPDARHVVLDPFQQQSFSNRGLRALEEAGVISRVEFHAAMSQIALPAFLHEGRSFDFGFVDGNHRFDSVFLDLFYLGRLLRRGAVIFLDDYDLPGIRRAVSFYVTNLGWRVEETSVAGDDHHWVVVRTAERPGEQLRSHVRVGRTHDGAGVRKVRAPPGRTIDARRTPAP